MAPTPRADDVPSGGQEEAGQSVRICAVVSCLVCICALFSCDFAGAQVLLMPSIRV